ncbi:MAG TPA: leucine-rich repeat domain-containing protein [Flavisolibacter sp.]|jgi:hypothetical protein|nr:leucine-rich repeat domain-containing protein [Flavisolibacter sp.]
MRFKKTALDYSGQKLTEFPKEIFTTPRLYKLNLANNNITVIPKEIAQLRCLETLDLTNNQIRTVGAKLFELTNLKVLVLNYNRIVNIPKQVEKLQRLKILNMSNNKLTGLPPELANLLNLEELNVTGNQLDDLPLINGTPFPNLKALWVAHNPLAKLSSKDIVDKLPKLKSFYCYSPNIGQPVLSSDIAIEYAAKTKGNSFSTLKGLYQDPDEALVYGSPHKTTSSTTTTMAPKQGKVFISYSHDDDGHYLKKLKSHLKVLGRDVPIDTWDDKRIKSSAKWKDEIETALTEATNAILLVSTYFLASDFIQNEELPKLLKAAEDKGTRIHPVIIEPCRFLKSRTLSEFQAANGPNEPLSELLPPAQERVWLKLMDDIQDYLEQ